MKILVNCYACSPYKGSEPGMGWNFVKCLSRLHELHILTEEKFRKDLDLYFDKHPEEKQYFHFYFIPKSRHKKLRKIWPPSYYWFYRKWQKKALKLARELDRIHHFDLVHQLNMVGYREPGYLYKLNKPLVWGPIGGLCISPWCLLPSTGLYGMLYYGARNLMNLFQMYCKHRVKVMVHKSDSIISATQDNHDGVLKIWGKESVIIPEVGHITTNQILYPTERYKQKLKICWSGQHTPGKALNLLLEALRRSRIQNELELHILGKGRCTSKWKRQAQQYGLQNIYWHGWVNRIEAIKIMKNCHLFCITSLADLTSTVLLEALSMGLPVITLNHCGFANVIDETCGIKIDTHSRKQVVGDLCKAIERIEQDENFRFSLSQGALARAKDFNWTEKAEKIDTIYRQIIQQ